jgi:regulator of sirC expression with transglutaminase-like and TPR domain
MYQAIPELAYFRLLISDADAIPLFEAAASIGQDAHPTLDLQGTLAKFDEMARELSEACRGATTEMLRLQRLLGFIYVTQGFAGNANDYYNADNSYLHRVIETRRGIPITLAVLLCELAEHIGIKLEGIAFPGHFLVKANLHEGIVVIDPFTGKSLDYEALEIRAAPYGMSVERLLRPASARQILIRMLSNLQSIHEQQRHPELLGKVMQRLQMLQEDLAS